jgi:hypothetical protein
MPETGRQRTFLSGHPASRSTRVIHVANRPHTHVTQGWGGGGGNTHIVADHGDVEAIDGRHFFCVPLDKRDE